jgi:hypothetical protein
MKNPKRKELKQNLANLKHGDVITLTVRNYNADKYERQGVFVKYANNRVIFISDSVKGNEEIHITRIDKIEKYEQKIA